MDHHAGLLALLLKTGLPGHLHLELVVHDHVVLGHLVVELLVGQKVVVVQALGVVLELAIGRARQLGAETLGREAGAIEVTPEAGSGEKKGKQSKKHPLHDTSPFMVENDFDP
ncbi:MAG: hypothetical protein GWN94_06425 [Phycisphaerae bacterium]|nr:hypothetical protein [Phycisphaerae bacterium]